MAVRIILDVDTGIDDALAILLAAWHPDIGLEAVTTVYGNIEVDQATRNTLDLLDLAGRSDVPVARGAARALTRPYLRKAAHIHGENGVGEAILPPSPRAARSAWAPATPSSRRMCPWHPATARPACALRRMPRW